MLLNNNHRLVVAASILMLSACMASCNSHEDEITTDLAQTRGVKFSIPLAAEDAMDAGLQIFLYDTAGTKPLGQVEITDTEVLADGSQMVHGLIPLDSEAITDEMLQCHMVVLANCTDTDGSTASLQTLTFDANTSPIPMYGAHSIQTRLDRRLEVLCPTTYLLRSGALVTVQLAEELTQAGIALKSATVSNANLQGYCAPLSATKLTTGNQLAVSTIFNPYTQQQGDIALLHMTEGAMEGLIPECSTPVEGPVEMSVEFMRNGEDYTGIFGHKLFFKDYTDDVPFDIVRGHHYIFTIRSLQTEGELEVKVEDWDEKTAEDVIFK